MILTIDSLINIVMALNIIMPADVDRRINPTLPYLDMYQTSDAKQVLFSGTT
jgi:hypothetical protein